LLQAKVGNKKKEGHALAQKSEGKKRKPFHGYRGTNRHVNELATKNKARERKKNPGSRSNTETTNSARPSMGGGQKTPVGPFAKVVFGGGEVDKLASRKVAWDTGSEIGT